MEKIDEELGKQLVYDYYKVGNWYVFPMGTMIKYLKVEKIHINKNMTERIFLRGTGFVILEDALHIPKTIKDEAIIFCWANDYIKKYTKIDEEKVKEIYKTGMEKSYKNIFEN